MSRRRLLLVAGAGALGVLGAACGAPAPPTPTREPTPLPTPSPTAVPLLELIAKNPPPTVPAPVGAARTADPAGARTAVATSTPNPIAWRLRSARETIKGFADRVSTADGDVVGLYATTPASTIDVDVYRFGWYDGGRRAAELIDTARGLKGGKQPDPEVDAQTGLISCARWQRSGELKVKGWPTGIYLLKLTASDGDDTFVPLVVRDDQKEHDYLLEYAATTDQAYNSWGGKSLYDFNSKGDPTLVGTRAAKVSFDRPHEADGAGAGRNILRWVISFVRWAEANNLDLAYVSDLDVHAEADVHRRAKVLLQVGHNEYWSKEMRDHLEAARDAGKGLGFFTGDTGGWAIRFEDTALGKNRAIVCYKDRTKDPLAATDPERATVHWNEAPINRPLQTFLGVGTNGPVAKSADWTVAGVANAPKLFEGTGFSDGDVVRKLVGYEYDGMWTPGGLGAEPAGRVLLGRAHVEATVPPPPSSFRVERSLPNGAAPLGTLSARIEPLPAWLAWSVDVLLAAAGGSWLLRYRATDGGPSVEKGADVTHLVVPIGAKLATGGPTTVERDLRADYQKALGSPIPADARVAAFGVSGAVTLRSCSLSGGGSGYQVPLDDQWKIADGKGELTPKAGTIVARAAEADRRADEAHTVAVAAPGKGLVIAVGSIQWAWGLDDFRTQVDAESGVPVDQRLQVLTRNMLRALKGELRLR